jgi:hypothetical protein
MTVRAIERFRVTNNGMRMEVSFPQADKPDF